MEEVRRIINTYDQNVAAGGDRIVIYRQIQDTGPGGNSAAWQVGRYRDGKPTQTDAKAAWYDYGKKTFMIWGYRDGETLAELRKRTLQEAIDWANANFGAREFVKNRLGDYVEKEVNEKFPIPKREK